jgi:uridine phosphorylase
MSRISDADLILNRDGSVYHLSLLPEHISETIITVGDPDRVDMVSQYFDSVDFRMRKREFVTHRGTLRGKSIMVVSTGMGTDNVEIFLTELDALVNVNLKTRTPRNRKKKLKIIRVGTSGSLQKDVPLDSHVVSDYAVGLDSLMHFYKFKMNWVEKQIAREVMQSARLDYLPYVAKSSPALLQKIGFDMIVGNTITTPGFFAPQGRIVRLQPKNPKMLSSLARHGAKNQGLRLINFEMETAGYYSLAKLLGHETLSVSAIVANRAIGKFSNDPNAAIDALIRKVLSRV